MSEPTFPVELGGLGIDTGAQGPTATERDAKSMSS